MQSVYIPSFNLLKMATNNNNNYCLAKYIHLKDFTSEKTPFHTTQDYEFRNVTICHTSYDEMVQRVADKCPGGFSCVHPITLHHEVLWKTRLLMDEDHLFRPIDESDYVIIKWNKSIQDTEASMLSICVQIQRDVAFLS